MNDRKLATLIWLSIALVFGMRSADIRSSLWQVVKAFVQPLILGPLAAFAAWTAGLVVLAHAVGVWERDVRSDTIVWFVTVGVTLFFSLETTAREGFFRRAARRSVKAAVFVEAFANPRHLRALHRRVRTGRSCELNLAHNFGSTVAGDVRKRSCARRSGLGQR